MDVTIKIAKKLKVKGLINIQFVVHRGEVYVLEVNPRASRTIPFLSKITGVTMANIATRAIMGESLREMGYEDGVLPEPKTVSVKVPVFSFAKLRSVDIMLGPEMKSTGEAIGRDRNLDKALYKGLTASGLQIPMEGSVLLTVADKDKEEAYEIAKKFYDLGFRLFATKGTASYLSERGIEVTTVGKIDATGTTVLSIIENGEVQFVVNTLTSGKKPRSDGFRIRREAVEHGIACLTSLDTAEAIVNVIDSTTFTARPAVEGKAVVR